MPEPSWCRSCGRETDRVLAVCAACGVELTVAGGGDPRVGRTVPGRGTAVATDGVTVLVLGPAPTPIAVPVDEFDRLGEVTVDGPPVLGEAGRIWAAGDPRADKYAEKAATASLSARRAAAVDAIALGRLSWLPGSGLTESELLWYRAREACRTGAADRMLTFLEGLPAEGYPARVTLLLIQAPALLDDPGRAERAVRMLEPFGSADAQALRLVLLEQIEPYLRKLTRLVCTGKFEEALRLGRIVRRQAPDGPLAIEVTNLIAYAKWQLGHAAEALAELLAGGDALLANAAVVAGGIGWHAALEPLGRLCRRATDPRVRHAALLRAVSLWLADDEVPAYPDELAALVRDALADPIDDDGVYHALVKVSSTNDAAWLGGAAVHFDNPTQADLMRYFQTRARMLDPDRPERLADLARVLVTIWGREPRPEWIVRERDWMATMLSNLVHRPFGEAAVLRPAIETLLDGDALELPQRLVLAAQAGGHVAMSLAEGAELSRQDERRLLFDPVHLFFRRRAELPGPVADRIGAELGRCLAVAATVVTRTLLVAVDKIGEEYQEISFRREWDQAHLATLRAEQLRLLDRMADAVTRLRSYLLVLERLPVPADLTGVPRMVREEANWLAAQVAGLRALGVSG